MASATEGDSVGCATLTHSAVLWHKIELARPRLHASSVRFWTSNDLARRFPRFLCELRQIISGGLDVMRLALLRSLELAPRDPLAAACARYYAEHIKEEKNHDEWLLQDMAAIGIDREQALGRMISAEVAALLGAQEYWVRHEHPVAFLGYVAVVEGDPPRNDHLDSIQAATGYPAEAFRCLREHAEADIGHLAELRAAIDAMPHEARHRELLGQSAFETVHALARIFDRLSARGGA